MGRLRKGFPTPLMRRVVGFHKETRELQEAVMGCFGMDWLFHFLILLVVVCVVVGVLMVVVPWALSFMGLGVSGPVMQIIRIIVAGIVLIFIIYTLWMLWDCFAGGGGVGLPPRR